MIKTAVIIERADVALGGAERSIFELTAQLGGMGIDVTLLAAKGESSVKKVTVLCDGDKSKRTSLANFQDALRQHLAENEYDIVHSTLPFSFADIYQPRGGSYPEAVMRNAVSYGNRLIASLKLITHYANFRRTALLRAEKNLCTNDNETLIVALSEYVARQFKQHYQLDDERVVVIGNGVKAADADEQKADKLRGQLLKKFRLNEGDDPVLFLFAANNFRLKGLDSIIKALGALHKKDIAGNACLVVAGAGKQRKYQKLAGKLSVDHKIVFSGALSNIQNLLAACDVGLLPTYYDPCSRFALEALSAEKPVITTRYNGAAERFENRKHGVIIDGPEDIDALAEAIGFYSDKKNITDAAAAIVADGLKEEISIQRHARRLIELYKLILQKRKDK